MSEQVISTAGEMVEGQVYKTCESDLSYFTRIVPNTKKDGKVTIEALMKSGKWKPLEVPEAYKVRALSEGESTEFTTLSAPKAKKEKKPRDPNAPKREGGFKKVAGLVTGKGMIAAWAHYINEYVKVEGGRTAVINAMIAEFPNKVDSINKWVDAYLTYYNTGRFSAQGFGRQEKSLPWILSEAEKAAGLKNRPVRDLTKKAEAKPEVAAAPAA